MSIAETTRQQLISNLRVAPANVTSLLQRRDTSGNDLVDVTFDVSYDADNNTAGAIYDVQPKNASDAYVFGILTGLLDENGDAFAADLNVAGPNLANGTGFFGVTVKQVCPAQRGTTVSVGLAGWVYVSSEQQAYAFSFDKQIDIPG